MLLENNKEFNNIIKFFNKYYGVDVGGVEIIYKDMDNEVGHYNVFTFNKIFISNKVKGRGVAEEVVIVHEINHLLQHENNIGLTLNKDIIYKEFNNVVYDTLDVTDIDTLYYNRDIKAVKSIDDIYEMNDYIASNYWAKHIEIDSRLAEGLYLYEEFCISGIDILIDHIFKCGSIKAIEDRINNIPNDTVKELLLNKYNELNEQLAC